MLFFNGRFTELLHDLEKVKVLEFYKAAPLLYTLVDLFGAYKRSATNEYIIKPYLQRNRIKNVVFILVGLFYLIAHRLKLRREQQDVVEVWDQLLHILHRELTFGTENIYINPLLKF